MDRRSFLASSAAAAGGMAFGLGARNAIAQSPPSDVSFADKPLAMAVPPHWFSGDILEQLEQVAAWGFPAWEWLGPSGDLEAIRAKSDELGLRPTCIGGAGHIAPGGMVNPDDHDAVENQFREQLEKAKILNCKRLIGLTGNERDDVSREQQTDYVVQCLQRLAPIAEDNDVTIIMEPLNTLVDHPGFFLNTTEHAVEIMQRVDSPNVRILFDIYHQQITEGNVIRNIRQNIQWIDHFHVADNPGRQEPSTGELNYANIFKAIHDTGYDGFVALECGQSDGVENALLAVHDTLVWS